MVCRNLVAAAMLAIVGSAAAAESPAAPAQAAGGGGQPAAGVAAPAGSTPSATTAGPAAAAADAAPAVTGAGQPAPVPASGDTIVAHGVAVFDELRLPADFAHLAYVNPDAPKGGEISEWAAGGFDSFNPYTVKGRGTDSFYGGKIMENAVSGMCRDLMALALLAVVTMATGRLRVPRCVP